MTSSNQCSLRLLRLRLGQLLFLISPTWKGFWSSIGSVYAYFFYFFNFFWRMTGWVWGTERWANIKQQRFEANSGEGERNQQAGSRCCVCFGRLKWKGLVGCPTGCPQHFRRSSLWRSRNQSDVVYVTWVSTWVSTSLLFLLCSLRDCQQHLGKRKHADELTAIRIRFTILRWEKKEAWARK